MTVILVNDGNLMLNDGNPVTTEAELNAALVEAAGETANSGAFEIDLGADLVLSTALEAINLKAGVTLDINGNGFTLDGGGGQRGLFVYSGDVTIENLTLANMTARGGNGGAYAGGGGAGLGGALFVAGSGDPGQAVTPNVTLDNVSFANDSAIGGNGGASINGYFAGGGGGLGGNGGNGAAGGSGGGGGGIGGTGGDAYYPAGGTAGANGIIPDVAGGGGTARGGAGSASAGGGGGGSGGGGGGIGGGWGGDAGAGFEKGAAGGFGGGGGGSKRGGGNGGFGGGGGAGLLSPGNGGFGGGGGGGGFSNGGGGGFGGGSGAINYSALGAGGGGLGAGGDIFVQQGASLTILGGTVGSGSVAGGAGGGGGAGSGRAYGDAIFLQGNQSLVLAPASGQTLTISGGIADVTGSHDASGQTGAGSLVMNGTGTLVLGGSNTYTGATVVQSGMLLVDGSSANSAITVENGATLGGHGTTGAVTVQSGGIFAPGNSPGQITVGALRLNPGAYDNEELDGTSAGTGYDQTIVRSGGTVGLNGATLNISSYAGFRPANGDVFTIIDNQGSSPVTGTFAGLAQGATMMLGEAAMQISYAAGDGNDVTLTVTKTILNGGNAITTEADLSAALAEAAGEAANSGRYEIDLGADLSIGTALSAINLQAGVTLDIEGNGHTLDGGGSQRGFFVYSGNVTIADLTLQNMAAKGGDGGNAGGGGGAGLGGALFIAGSGDSGQGATPNVTLDNVSFANDSAIGGNGGGQSASFYNIGGGGGLGGGGGNGGAGGGGGGGGIGGNGGNSIDYYRYTFAGNGIVPGASGGGASARAAGGASGGGGGAAPQNGGGAAGGGGIGGETVSGVQPGGAGGFGGGGGGGPFGGGIGGFGGGGGAGVTGVGGDGGFGGGGGSDWGDSGTVAGIGGFGAGNGGSVTSAIGGGGGGLGAGGDIFVQAGASLTILGGAVGAGTVAGGVGGGAGAGNGQGYGSGIFLQGNQSLVFSPASGQTLTISGAIADMTGSQDGSGQTGAGSLVIGNGISLGTVKFAPVDAHGNPTGNTFTGGITIKSGTLEIASAGAAGTGTIRFASADVDPTLQIDISALPAGGGHFANPIVGFGGPDDVIDIAGLKFISGATASDDGLTLTFTDGGVTWTFDTPGATPFVEHVFADDHGGTAIACYTRGTLIATARGDVSVEKLAIGDRVLTASGALRPIKWIGARSYGGRFIMGRKDILPVCFKAGSLGEALPRRDLWISPHHAMYFENETGGVLVEAKDLVNGVSIVQAEQVDEVEYFHIELDTHDVILAEGAPSETFVDDDSRAMFHNAHEYAALYGEDTARDARYCAPRVEIGYAVETIRRKLAEHAGLVSRERGAGRLRGCIDAVTPHLIEGWAQTVDHPGAPVCLDIYAAGQLIGQTFANRYRADLEAAGLGSGRHGFSFAVPDGQTLLPATAEVRRSLDGASLAPSHVASPRLRATAA